MADPDAFFAAAHERILDHGIRDPIFSAHLVEPTAAHKSQPPRFRAAKARMPFHFTSKRYSVQSGST